MMSAGSKNAVSRHISLRKLLQDVAIEEGHNLCSSAGVLGGERRCARAVGNTVFDRPKNRI